MQARYASDSQVTPANFLVVPGAEPPGVLATLFCFFRPLRACPTPPAVPPAAPAASALCPSVSSASSSTSMATGAAARRPRPPRCPAAPPLGPSAASCSSAAAARERLRGPPEVPPVASPEPQTHTAHLWQHIGIALSVGKPTPWHNSAAEAHQSSRVPRHQQAPPLLLPLQVLPPHRPRPAPQPPPQPPPRQQQRWQRRPGGPSASPLIDLHGDVGGQTWAAHNT